MTSCAHRDFEELPVNYRVHVVLLKAATRETIESSTTREREREFDGQNPNTKAACNACMHAKSKVRNQQVQRSNGQQKRYGTECVFCCCCVVLLVLCHCICHLHQMPYIFCVHQCDGCCCGCGYCELSLGGRWRLNNNGVACAESSEDFRGHTEWSNVPESSPSVWWNETRILLQQKRGQWWNARARGSERISRGEPAAGARIV